MTISNELKAFSRKITHMYIKKGVIKKPNECEECKKITKLDAHHKDYSDPKNVVWLCRKCHVNLHFKNGDLRIGKATSTSFKKGYDKRRNITNGRRPATSSLNVGIKGGKR